MRVAALLACPLAAALAPCGGSNVALVTPMVAGSNAVDYGALRSLLEWHVECGTAGVVALGTTGEASTLSGEERAEVRGGGGERERAAEAVEGAPVLVRVALGELVVQLVVHVIGALWSSLERF